MESMEEFDRESPMVMTFCQLLSEDEFEEQGLSYTERALRDLFLTMERQPELCERVVRRRKQAELERGAVGTAIRVRACVCASWAGRGAAVCVRVHVMGGAGGRRVRALCVYVPNANGIFFTTVTHPQLSFFTPQPGAQTPLRDQANVRRAPRRPSGAADCPLLPSVRNSCVDPPAPPDLGDPHADIHTAILACNPLKRLKATGIERSPGGTPICTPRRSRLAGGQESSPASAFNTALLSKFRSAQSPAPEAPPADSPGSSCSDGSGFATPPGSP
nr:PREDICTED: uncharacterized protein LOC107079703 [Lepisosteus oculatus]